MNFKWISYENLRSMERILYQCYNNPKWAVEIGIRCNVLLHIINWCPPRHYRWHNSFPYDARINVEKLLIKFNTKYGMAHRRALINVVWKHKMKFNCHKEIEKNSFSWYLPDGDRCRSSFWITFTLALIELIRSCNGSLVVVWSDVVVAFWYGDRCRFGELILISALPPCEYDSCTGEYSLNDKRSSAFILRNENSFFQLDD